MFNKSICSPDKTPYMQFFNRFLSTITSEKEAVEDVAKMFIPDPASWVTSKVTGGSDIDLKYS